MLVKDIMSTKVETVTPDTPVADCAKKMRDLGIGALPVWEDGTLSGMITDRDVCCRAVAEGRDLARTVARDIMSTDVASCFDDQDYENAAYRMEGRRLRRLAVIDHDSRVVGMLSVDDLARHSAIVAGEVLKAAAPAAH